LVTFLPLYLAQERGFDIRTIAIFATVGIMQIASAAIVRWLIKNITQQKQLIKISL